MIRVGRAVTHGNMTSLYRGLPFNSHCSKLLLKKAYPVVPVIRTQASLGLFTAMLVLRNALAPVFPMRGKSRVQFVSLSTPVLYFNMEPWMFSGIVLSF